jgi:hypothetical protein
VEIIVDDVVIASLYPGQKPRISKPFGPDIKRSKGATTWFELKPVKRGGKPFLLKVSDMFQHYRDELNSGKPWKVDPVECTQIADNLVTEWAGNIPNLPPGAFPGIMRIIGNVPTQDELEFMREGMTAYFEFMFLEGDQMSKQNPKWVSPEHRLAAEWLGRATPWANSSQALRDTICPSCKQPIPLDALRCHLCGAQVKAFTGELAALNQAFVGPVISTPEEVGAQ